MIHRDDNQLCPDWFCTPARCRCGAEWAVVCDHLDIPPNVELGTE